MTLKDMIVKAYQGQDPKAAGAVVDFLRFRHRMNYQQVFQTVQKVCPEADPRQWETLLESADTAT